FEVLRRLREHSDVAVIMVTARGEEADRVMGLEGGADDYVSKPFASRELLARIRAHARRARQRTQAPNRRSVAGALVVDGRARVASFRGDVVELTTYEFELLQVFVQRAGQVLTREQLVEAVRGSAEEAFDRRKLNFKLFNMLGIPFAFALFGAIRWRMRNTRRKNLSL
ncbi:MAG: response regulator transcription factor, partial [Myxococcota bacterium]